MNLDQARLALMCCEPWQFLKMWRLSRRIKELEAVENGLRSVNHTMDCSWE